MIDVAIAAAALGGVYVAAARGVRWPGWRTAAFLCGLAASVAALAVGDATLPRHMVEHAAIASVSAPLIVLGAPLTLALRALPPPPRRELAALAGCRPIAVLAHPAVALLSFATVMVVYHVTLLLPLGDRHPALHAAEHALLFGTALLVWTAAIGAEPRPYRLRDPARSLYLLLAMPAGDAVGAWLMATGHRAAGAAMLAGMLPFGLAATLCAWRWVIAEERRAVRLEAIGGAG